MNAIRLLAPALLLAVLGGAAPRPATASPELPELEVTTLDGAPWSLAGQRGRWVVVNFWATWCKPCIKEIPDLDALDRRRDDLVVIGLAYEETDPDELRAFLERHPASYPIAMVDVYEPPADFDTPRGLPMTYLIAPDGSVARRFLGPVTPAEIEQVTGAPVAAASAPTQDH